MDISRRFYGGEGLRPLGLSDSAKSGGKTAGNGNFIAGNVMLSMERSGEPVDEVGCSRDVTHGLLTPAPDWLLLVLRHVYKH